MKRSYICTSMSSVLFFTITFLCTAGLNAQSVPANKAKTQPTPDLPMETPDEEDLPPSSNIPGEEPGAVPADDEDNVNGVPAVDPSLMLAPPAEGGGGPVGVPQVEGSTTTDPNDQPDTETSMDNVPSPDSSTRTIIEARRKRFNDRNKQPMFGSYRFHVGAAKPRFAWNDTYIKHYGAPSVMPVIGVDYFAFDWFVTLGLAFRFGYYKDTGYALKRENGELVKDKKGKTSLTLIPLQVAAAMELTPFPAKWIVLSGWVGFEYLSFEEVRDQASSSNTSSSGSTTSLADASTSSDSEGGLFLTKGWRKSSVVGLATSFKFDWADGQSSGSLATVGMRSIYVTPFVEAITSIDKEKANFTRKAIGLLFSFESIN